MKNRKIRKPAAIIGIISCVVILGLCVCGALLQYRSDTETVAEKLINGIPLLFVGVFAMAGVFAVAESITTLVYRIKNCTYITEARCVGLDSRYSDDSEGAGSLVYTPIYEFEYNGRAYRIRNNAYSSKVFMPGEGSTAVIHVDIDDEREPGDYYIDTPYNGITAKLITGLVLGIPTLGVLIVSVVSKLG